MSTALIPCYQCITFLAPFFAPIVPQSAQPQAGAATAPLLLTALVGLCFLAPLFEVQGSELSAKSVALLGILVAINSVLGFATLGLAWPAAVLRPRSHA